MRASSSDGMDALPSVHEFLGHEKAGAQRARYYAGQPAKSLPKKILCTIRKLMSVLTNQLPALVRTNWSSKSGYGFWGVLSFSEHSR